MNKVLRKILENNILRDKFIKNPIVLVDVGAGGHFNKTLKNLINRNLMKLIAFEPQVDTFNSTLNRNNIQFFDIALFNKEASMPFFITHNKQCSSLLKPNYKLLQLFSNIEDFKIETTSNILTKRLDTVLDENGINDVDLLKIDVQGVAYEVLEGSVRVLENTYAIEVETEFVQLYEQEKLFPEIHNFLTAKNFVLIDMRRHFWKYKDLKNYFNIRGQLIFCDALYFKNVDWFSVEIDYNKLIKSIFVFLLYNRADYAYEVFKKFKNSLPEDINTEMSKIFSNNKILYLPNFRGKYRIIKFIHKIEEILLNNNGQLSDIELGD